jgi:hypothetical protein
VSQFKYFSNFRSVNNICESFLSASEYILGCELHCIMNLLQQSKKNEDTGGYGGLMCTELLHEIRMDQRYRIFTREVK